MTSRLWLAIAAVALVAGGGFGSGCAERAPADGGAAAEAKVAEAGPALVLVRAVENVTVDDEIRFSGTVTPVRQTMISPKIPGTIQEITKRAGDRIAKGDVLVRLDPTDYDLAVRQANAQLAVARAAVAQAAEGKRAASLPLERFRKLKAAGSVPDAEFDRVESQYRLAVKGHEAARAQVELAKVGLAAAEEQLSNTRVEAPFDGFVVKRLVDEGEVARAMPPTIVLVVVEAPPYYVEGSVNEIDAVRLREGTTLAARLDALPGVSVTATVTNLNAMVDPETRSVAVRALVQDGIEHLKIGMSAELTADMGQRSSLFVPRVAFVERAGDRAKVFVVDGERATPRDIRLGAVHRDGFFVLDGLVAGERVVVAGQGDIGPEGAVEVKHESGAGPATPPGASESAPKVAGDGVAR